MKSMRRLKVFLASLALTSFVVTSAFGMPGQYSKVKKGDISPFDGYCFDIFASAYIIADKETRDLWCTDKINKSLAIQKAEFDLRVGKLQAEFEYQKSVSEKTIDALREENLKLEGTALDAPNNYWYVFLGTGVLAGVVATLLVTQATR